MLLGQVVVAQEPQAPTAVLTTKRMCCSKESGPAIKELSKISGVDKVVANHRTRSLSITTKGKATISPKAIWEAAERMQLEPTRLATTQGVYTAKPTR
jgi:hypothetical protein